MFLTARWIQIKNRCMTILSTFNHVTVIDIIWTASNKAMISWYIVHNRSHSLPNKKHHQLRWCKNTCIRCINIFISNSELSIVYHWRLSRIQLVSVVPICCWNGLNYAARSGYLCARVWRNNREEQRIQKLCNLFLRITTIYSLPITNVMLSLKVYVHSARNANVNRRQRSVSRKLWRAYVLISCT